MFETGSYFASRAEHIDSMMAAAWMPLAWLAVWKLGHKLRADWLAVLAAALGMSIWGGFPQATVAVFGSTLMFAVLLASLEWRAPARSRGPCCGCALGILLAAVPFIPTTAAHRIERGEVSRGLSGHRRRALLAEPGVAGGAESLQHIRHEPF